MGNGGSVERNPTPKALRFLLSKEISKNGILIRLQGRYKSIKKYMDTPNQNASAPKNVGMGILAYIGPLVIVSYLAAKDDLFVKFHIKQGLVLLTIEIIAWLLGSALWSLWMLLNLVNLATLVLSVIGIINVTKGEEKKLPLVGDFAKHFTF